MNASTGDAPESRAELVPAARIAPMTAIPSEPPTWRNVLSIPEPTPALSTGTELSAAAVIGVIMIAMPTPPSSIPGRSERYDESVCSWAKTSSAPLSIVIPAVISQREPSLSDERPAIGATRMIRIVIGRKAAPARTAL